MASKKNEKDSDNKPVPPGAPSREPMKDPKKKKKPMGDPQSKHKKKPRL